jgi:hypothetical protein
MRRTHAAKLIAALILLCAQPATAGQWAGSTETVDGVLHVHNPAEPIEGERVIAPERLWSIGGEDDEDDPLFGAVTEVLADGDGNTYLLDFQMLQVMVLDPTGALLRTIGRGGVGPGEFRMPLTMRFLTENRLVVVQTTPARAVVFDLAGEPQPDFPLPVEGGFANVNGFRPAGDHVVIAVQSSSFDTSKITVQGRILVLDRGGAVLSTLWTRDHDMNPSKMVVGSNADAVLPVWTVAAGGNVQISAEYNRYRIEELDHEGNTVRVIDREYESRRRTEEELDGMMERFSRFPQQGIEFEIKLDETDRDILQMQPRDDGELWVTSSRLRDAPGEGQLGPFEVFDPDGRYVQDVRIEVEIETDRDSWHIAGDRLYVIRGGQSAIRSAVAGITGGMTGLDTGEEDEDALPPEVVCYRLSARTD